MTDFFGLNVRGVKGVAWRGKGPHDAPKPLQYWFVKLSFTKD